jgi:hypothetical protein
MRGSVAQVMLLAVCHANQPIPCKQLLLKLCAKEFVSWSICAKCAEQHIRDMDVDDLIAGGAIANECTGFGIDEFCRQRANAPDPRLEDGAGGGESARSHAHTVMMNLLKGAPHTSPTWVQDLQEKERGKPMLHTVRVDIEMPGMLASTFDKRMKQLLHISFCAAVHVPASSVECARITEWDLSVVVQYQIKVVSAAAVDRLILEIESAKFPSRVVESIVQIHPDNAGRLQEMFSTMEISKPMVLSSHDHAENLWYVHHVASVENILIWCFVGSTCGFWIINGSFWRYPV